MNIFKASFLLSMLVLGVASPVSAELAIKKLIMTDCPKALEELKKLPEPKRMELIPYLSLVLKLQAQSPFATGVDPSAFIERGPLGVPIDDASESEAWKSLQPARELEAKRCTVEILRTLAPSSFSSVPDLISLAEDPATPSDLRESVSDVMVAITESAVATQGYAIPDEILKKIVQLPEGEGHFFAENVLIELGERVVPLLVDEMRKPDAAKRSALAGVMGSLDSVGVPVEDAASGLLQSGGDGIRKRALALLGQLHSPTSTTWGVVSSRLTDLSPSVQDQAANTLVLLLKKLPDSFVPDQKDSKLIYEAFAASPIARRDIIEKILARFSAHGDQGEPFLIKWSGGEDLDLKRRAIDLLGKRSSLTPEGYSLLSKLAQEERDADIVVAAINALGGQKGRIGDVVSLLAKLLKANGIEKDSVKKGRVLYAVSEGIVRLGSGGKETPRLIAALTEGLKGPGIDPTGRLSTETDLATNPIVRALIVLGKDGALKLSPLFKDSDPLVRVRAAFIAGQLRSSDTASIQTLIGLLKDDNKQARVVSEHALISIGAPVIPSVSKLIKSSSVPQRLASGSILVEPTKGNDALIPVLIEGTRAAECGEKPRFISRIAALQRGTSPQLAEMVLQCLVEKNGSLPTVELVSALAALGPFQGDVLARIVDLVKGQSLDRSLRIRLLDNWKALGIPTDELIAIVKPMLKDPDNSVRYFAINLVSGLGAHGTPTLPDLSELRDDNSVEPLLQHEAALAAVSIDPASFDFGSYFIEELRGERQQWAERSLKKLGSQMAIPILERALGEVPEERLSPVLLTIGEFGKDARSLVPRIIPLLVSKYDSVRSAALIALLHLAPATPEILPVLRREILTERRKVLFDEEFPPDTLALFRALRDRASSRVERFVFEQIVDRRGSNAHKTS